MAIQTTKYETSQQNAAQILAAGTVTLLSTITDKQGTAQHGSFNYLEVINDSAYEIYLDLDQQSTRRRILFGKSVLIINAEESCFFNNVLVTNADSSGTIAANLITVNARIVKISGV